MIFTAAMSLLPLFGRRRPRLQKRGLRGSVQYLTNRLSIERPAPACQAPVAAAAALAPSGLLSDGNNEQPRKLQQQLAVDARLVGPRDLLRIGGEKDFSRAGIKRREERLQR